MEQKTQPTFDKDYSKYGFKDPEESVYKTQKGLSRAVVEEISKQKDEPKWMLEIRLKALDHFWKRPLPMWGADLTKIDFEKITYYFRPTEKRNAKSWDDVPEKIKKTFERLGIPEAERKFLAGVGGQYESENIYHSLKEDLARKGVIFSDVETAEIEHPELVKKYFGKVVPFNDNKFAALNTAVFSGGSFVFVPKGVKVDLPLQAYFRINAASVGQFERTLIIGEPESFVHYIEGCSAPVEAEDSLHTAVVELLAMNNSRLRYTTIQNWSTSVYNLVTKRAFAYENATVEWIDGNLGSKVTMKYPSVYLLGRGARAEMLSIAFAGKGQHLDAGSKAVHLAPDTTSVITSKSASRDGGRTTYRGLVSVAPGCSGVKANVVCDALILDDKSASDTVPYMEINEKDVNITHEATCGKVGEDQLFYLMSRGLTEQEALAMIVNGFMEPFTKSLPLEYAVELNRLIEMQMEGSVG